MNLLSQLLPAIREVRAPLVAGYLWILVAWLSAGDSVPDDLSSSDAAFWRLLGRFANQFGDAGLVAAASVAAYLVGSLIGEVIDAVADPFGEERLLRNQLALIEEARLGPNPALERSVGPLAAMLDGANRLASEATFRFHVTPPLLALSVPGRELGLMGMAGPLVAGFLLLGHGLYLRRRANRIGSTIAFNLKEAGASTDDEGADIQIKVEREQASDGRPRRAMRIANTGVTSAKTIDVQPADDDDFPELPGGVLPLEQLDAGDSVALPLGITFSSPPSRRVLVTWVDASGQHQKNRVLHFS